MYRENDIDIIKKNIDKIKEDALREKLNILEPTSGIGGIVVEILKLQKQKNIVNKLSKHFKRLTTRQKLVPTIFQILDKIQFIVIVT